MKPIVVYAIAFVVLVNEIHGQSEEKKQICTPGARSQVKCNTCTCSADGTALGCTRMECPDIPAEYLNPDGSLKLPHQTNPLLRTRREIPEQSEEKQQICTPGARSQVKCNTCTCSADGTALACTRMKCPDIPAEYLNPDGSLKLPHQTNPLLRTRREVPGQSDENKQICTPGARSQVKCNTCTCSADGTALACTRMKCPDIPAEYLNPDGSLKLPHQTNPLLRTRREVSGQSEEKKQICTPGARSQVKCNTCICSKDGTALGCTRMECPDIPAEYLNPDGSLKLPHQTNPLLRTRQEIPLALPFLRQGRDRRCKPNSFFKEECNSCRCSPDGRSSVCTMMACESQLFGASNLDSPPKRPQESKPLLRMKRDELPSTCVPNQTFQYECHTCFCSADGRVAGCDYKFCINDTPQPSIDAPKIAT